MAIILLLLIWALGSDGDRPLPDFRHSELLRDDVSERRSSSGGYGIPPASSSRSSKRTQIPYGMAFNVDSSPYSTVGRDPADGTPNPALENEKEVVTGIPDLSDPCFRRYSNSIIVNAQPYERRSSIALVHCKSQCLQSQIGVYSCRSFVYDNVNQVCDLFAHVGNQSPARLLRFQTRDYFEPTAAINCRLAADVPNVLPPAPVFDPLPSSTNSPTTFIPATTISVPSAVSELTIDEEILPTTASTPILPSAPNDFAITDTTKGGTISCESGQLPRFLKTADFELHNHDDMRLEGVSLNECIDFCSTNFAVKDNGSAIKCNSFEFGADGVCVLSKETAVPLGNGQLKQKQGTDYFEKICVDERLTGECSSAVYNRFPQMILVGFAETVVDAPSLQHCFDNCLNSRQLYGFRCASGMYYFEEPQLNCILNTEDRTTQPDLFTSENSDLVDYFETSCNQSRAATRRFASPSSIKHSSNGLSKKDFVEATTGIWGEWSACSREGRQTREKLCAGMRLCGRDARRCSQTDKSEPPIRQVVEALRKAKCPPDVCCPVFGPCNIGIIQNSALRQLQWCTTRCDTATAKPH